MRTLVVGCNHRSAPVALRERLAWSPDALPNALRALRERHLCAEAVLISTCNRMEMYIARPVAGHPRFDDVVAFLSEVQGLRPDTFAANLYSHEDTEAVRHLFRVVSSLDSMVLGESQILAQAKSAFDIARRVGTVGPELEGLFQRAFAVAKEIHTQTSLATGRVSVASTAVDLARQIFSRFDDKTVMMVGAGEMGELALTHVMETRPRELRVTNRTAERAADLARRFRERYAIEATPVPYAQWHDQLAEVDIVISSTGAREPILTAKDFKPIPKKRKYRPLLLIDIAVPRDIEPAVADVDESVYLYNIDDLQLVVETNLAQRRDAIGRCHDIIEQHVIDFIEKRSKRDIGPLVRELQQHFRAIGQRELDWILPKLDSASPHDRQLIEQLLHRVIQKLLNGPIRMMGDKAANGAAQVYAETLKAMFEITQEESAEGIGGTMPSTESAEMEDLSTESTEDTETREGKG